MYIYYYFYNDELLYIGSTKNIKKREAVHRTDLKRGSTSPIYVYLREKNLLIDDLEKEIILTELTDRDELYLLETKLIEIHNPLYNSDSCYIPGRTVAEYKIQYREANRDKIAEQNKQYREANKDKIAEQKKQYREANKEEIAEYMKKYNQANKDKIAEQKKQYMKKYREANRDKIAEQNKQYNQAKKVKMSFGLLSPLVFQLAQQI